MAGSLDFNLNLLANTAGFNQGMDGVKFVVSTITLTIYCCLADHIYVSWMLLILPIHQLKLYVLTRRSIRTILSTEEKLKNNEDRNDDLFSN